MTEQKVTVTLSREDLELIVGATKAAADLANYPAAMDAVNRLEDAIRAAEKTEVKS